MFSVKSGNSDLTRLAGFSMVIFAAALFPGFTVLRENRLARGVPTAQWQSTEPVYTIALVILLAAVVITLVFFKSRSFYPVLLAVLGNLLILFVFLALVEASIFLLERGTVLSRISLGAGAWMMLLGGYILTVSAVKEIASVPVRIMLTYLSLVFLVIFGIEGLFSHLSLVQEFSAKKGRFVQEFYHHLSLSFSSVGLAVLIGIPLGVHAYRKKRAEKSIFYFVNTAQTIPSLALFGLLIAPLSYLYTRFSFFRTLGIRGTGSVPALIALTLYALLPVTRNIYTGLKAVDPVIIQAGKGMGLSRFQLLFTIEIPLAVPIMLNGLRLAAVQAIGNTTVAALIGAGGFGFFIFQGLGQAATDLILLGALPVVILAVFVDRLMLLITGLLTPRGVKLRNMNTGGQV